MEYWIVEPLTGDYAGKVHVLSVHKTEEAAIKRAEEITKSRRASARQGGFFRGLYQSCQPLTVVKVLRTFPK